MNIKGFAIFFAGAALLAPQTFAQDILERGIQDPEIGRIGPGAVSGVKDPSIKPTISHAEPVGILATKVRTRIRTANPAVAGRINVQVSGKVVTLSGRVSSLAEKREALAVAGSVAGVARVVDKITLAGAANRIAIPSRGGGTQAP